MKKSSFLVGGALLLSALFTTSCKEMMSNLDQPVSSYLSVKEADVVVPTGDTYQIEITSNINSDKPVTYKSSDEKVATVDAKGLVTGVADGEATITVAVEASDYYQAGEQKIQVAVKRPLTFEALEDGGIDVNFYNGFVPEKPIIYSINGGAKQEITAYTWISLKKGDKVEFESANERLTSSDWNWGFCIRPGSQCAVYGNVMSMISPDGNYHTNKSITQPFALSGLLAGNTKWEEIPAGSGNWEMVGYNTVFHDKYKLLLPATTLTKGCYYNMFYNTGIIETPELPATELAPYCYQWMFESCGNLKKASGLPATELSEGCYGRMFYSCSSLTEAPALPATELKDYCYQNMFSGCTKLEKAPALPATKLAPYCYGGMFYNTAIKTAPALPATELANYCYEWMFESCTKLVNAPVLPATELKEGCYNSMFYGCTSLQKAPDLIAETLVDYCYQQMFRECTKLSYLKCLAKNAIGYSVTWMLYNAGTDESVTKRTLERDPDTYWYVVPGNYINVLYVPEGWTITPPYEAASAPKAVQTPKLAKEVPVLNRSARHQVEESVSHRNPMKPEVPEMFKK